MTSPSLSPSWSGCAHACVQVSSGRNAAGRRTANLTTEPNNIICDLNQDEKTETTKIKINMEDFFKRVGQVRGLIEQTSGQVEQVQRNHRLILSAPNTDTGHKVELEWLNTEIKKKAKVVRDKLTAMQEDFGDGASVVQRIQRNQHSHLTRWFAEVMRGHHSAQITFRDRCKAQIQRQLEIVNKVTSDEQLEQMLTCDNLTIFISDMDPAAAFPSETLTEIRSRHQDIVHLESSIRELHEVFADTAQLLEVQGELINSIERNVTSAAEYVDVSKAETHKAVGYKKNTGHKLASLPTFFKSFRRQTNTSNDEPDVSAV